MSSRHDKADTHILANRDCNSTHKSRASSNKSKSHKEREVDTKPHSLPRNYLQRIAALKGKINFYLWATLGILTTPHRASHMARSSWTIQNKLHVFCVCFCFSIFWLSGVFVFIYFATWKNEKTWSQVEKEGQGPGRNWGGERTW